MKAQLIQQQESDRCFFYHFKCSEFGEEDKDVAVNKLFSLEYDTIDSGSLIRVTTNTDSFSWNSYVVLPNGNYASCWVNGDHVNPRNIPEGSCYEGRRFCQKTHTAVDLFIWLLKAVPLGSHLNLANSLNTGFQVPQLLSLGDDMSNFTLRFENKFGSFEFATHTVLLKQLPVFKGLFTCSHEPVKHLVLHDDVTEDTARLFLTSLYSGSLALSWPTIDGLWCLFDKYAAFDRLQPDLIRNSLWSMIHELGTDRDKGTYWLMWADKYILDESYTCVESLVPMCQKAFGTDVILNALPQCPTLGRLILAKCHPKDENGDDDDD